MEQTKTTPTPAASPAPSIDTKPLDAHSYRGWLNSDHFWKRALAVYGYSFVGSLMISIPILIVIFLIALVLGAVFMGTMFMGGSTRQEPAQNPNMKINIDLVCEQSLAYTDFTDATSAAKYVDECKRGEHPEVIQHFRDSFAPSTDGATI